MAVAGYNAYIDGIKKNASLLATPEYTATGIGSGQSGNCYFTAVDDAGNESAAGTSASYLTKPGTVTGVAATAGDAQNTISWTATTGADSYKIERSTDDINYTSLVTGHTTTSYTDSTLTNGTTYYYRLKATNASGDSVNYSAVVSATPTAATGDTTSPTISSSTLNDPNTVDVTFSEGVYTGSTGTGALTAADFAIANFVAGGATALSVGSVTKTDGTALAGGETVVRCVLTLTGKAYGNETFNIIPASGTAIYDAAGNAMASTQTTAQLTLHPTGYDYLTDLQVALDDIGLATSTTNKYGTVDASNNVTKLKTIYPSALAVDWNLPTGVTGVTLGSGVNFDGVGYLTGNGGADGVLANFKPMHYSSLGIADMQATYHWVCKLGNVADPNAAYALMGTNGTASSKIGASVFFDDRASIPNSNAIRVFITHGAGFMVETKASDVVTPNSLFVLTVEVDGSIDTVDRVKVYINGVLQTNVMNTSSQTINANNPTHLPDLGAAGGGVLPMVGTIRGFAYTLAIDTATNRDNFINWLKGKNAIA